MRDRTRTPKEALSECDLKAEILQPDQRQEGYLNDYYFGQCGTDKNVGSFCLMDFCRLHPEFHCYPRSGICEHTKRSMRR